ncbi:MAG: type II secretion system ATPase GspE [Myxococcota bacterium]
MAIAASMESARLVPRRIGEILVEMDAVSAATVQNALEVQREKGGRLGQILLAMEAIDEVALARAIARQLDLPFVPELDPEAIEPKLVADMTLAYVRANGILPLEAPEEADWVRVAVVDPLNTFAIDDIRVIFDRDLELVVAPESQVRQAMHRVFDRRAGADQVVDDLSEEDLGTIAHDLEEQTKDILDEDDEAPIIRLVNSVLNQAIKERASDVHIEPYEKDIVVRFRKDGVLKEIVRAPKRFQASIASRIKIMGNLNIAEKRLPQDGRIRIKVAGRDVDLRLSTVPTTYGERLVLRILDKSSVLLDLPSLGFDPGNLETIEELIHRPHGIILVTGPTGSGKTTTLYAALSRINTPDRNILTVEDPVEYQIQGIGQMQVNRKIDFTFARGLRAILRQDPDVVLIGEIRDLETAENAIQAALTGHLVFATLHTNDAPSAFTRLTDMGVEPFLSASSVIAVMAQRLVRTLCTNCREPYEPTDHELERLGFDDLVAARKGHTIYRGGGCEECFHTGYKGRAGIHELMQVDEDLRSLVMQNTPASTLKRTAQKRGMKTLREDGAQKVLQGLTSIDEVMRVTAEDRI